MQGTVLIIAAKRDLHARSVACCVRRDFGAKCIILDSAEFPANTQLSVAISNSSDGPVFEIHTDGERIWSSEVTGIWWRRPKPHRFSEDEFSTAVRQFCFDESKAAFEGWLHSCALKVINPLAAESLAARKVAQLSYAIRAGLSIPETLITNSPEEAAAFTSCCDKKFIFKVLTGSRFCFADTRRVRAEHRQLFDALRHAPIILQREIENKKDIRATVVDDEVFAAEISPNHEKAQLDWRLDSSAAVRPHALPGSVVADLCKFMRSLGLRYGAVDMALQRDGSYVFFEVNPGGQFLFAEIHARLAISNALAGALTKRI
jgi:glutathione synthase/RimK-type ligase-like ATP-grasp enzyme